MEPPPAYDHTKQPACPPVQQSYQHQGYPNQPQPQPQPQAQPHTVQVCVPAQTTTQVVNVGNCPVCHIGNLVEQYSALGIVLAIFFFPLGLICCLLMTERVCSHCGARFGP